MDGAARRAVATLPSTRGRRATRGNCAASVRCGWRAASGPGTFGGALDRGVLGEVRHTPSNLVLSCVRLLAAHGGGDGYGGESSDEERSYSDGYDGEAGAARSARSAWRSHRAAASGGGSYVHLPSTPRTPAGSSASSSSSQVCISLAPPMHLRCTSPAPPPWTSSQVWHALRQGFSPAADTRSPAAARWCELTPLPSAGGSSGAGGVPSAWPSPAASSSVIGGLDPEAEAAAEEAREAAEAAEAWRALVRQQSG